MAGKKKKEKKKKKDAPGLSHIASTLVPSSIFAAVPRTPTSLSQSWPRRTPSPLALAVGEAGNIGRVVLGNFSRPASRTEENEGDPNDETGTPVAYLTTNVGDQTRGLTNGHSNNDQEEVEEGIEYEEPGYEAVKTRDGEFDKATKFYRMSVEGRQRLDSPEVSRSGETTAEHEGTSGHRFYHVLDKPEPPTYAKVDKSKKTSQAQKCLEKNGEGQEVEDLSLSEYSSSDELTDVTSRHVASDDEDNSLSGNCKLGTKRPLDSSTHARRKSKKECSSSEPTEENTEGKKGKLSSKLHVGESKKKKSIKKGNLEKSDEPGKDSTDGGWFKRKSKKKKLQQAIPEEDTAAPTGQQGGSQQFNISTDPANNYASASAPIVPRDPDDLECSSTADSTFNARQKEAMREVERLGFEGVSKKLGLDDLSEDDERYSPPSVPQNTTDFHGQTQFEREHFQDTLVEDYAQALNEQEVAELNESQLSNTEPIVSTDKKLSIEGGLRKWDTEKSKKGEHLLSEDAVGDMSVGEVVRNSKWVEAHGEPLMKPASPGSVRAKAALWNQAASKLEQAQDLHRQPGQVSKFEPVKGKGDELGLNDNMDKKQTQSSDQTTVPGTDRTEDSLKYLRKDTENAQQLQGDVGITETCTGTTKPLSSYSSHNTGIHDLHIVVPRSLGKGNTSSSTSELHGDGGMKSWKETSCEEHDVLHAEPGYIPPFATKQSRAFYHSEPSLYSPSAYREDGWRRGFSVTEESLLEQQKQLEKLIQHQQQVFETQLEEKEQQQQQQKELIQQQQKLQEQLKLIEYLQRERQLGSVSRSAETVTSDSEAVFQKELVQQQQEILQHQQEIQHEYQVQQERILKHQEKLYDQIMILESQQKQIQTNIGHLSPHEDELAEIRDREQRIVDLLSEQRQQQQQYEELGKLQQQRLEEQARFMEERKNLEQQQEALRGKVSEQENITRRLEQQLEALRSEAAASVARELADKSRDKSVQAERMDNSQSADRYEQENINSGKTERFGRSKVRAFVADSEIDMEESRHHRHRDSKSRKSKSRKSEKERNEEQDMRSKSRDRVNLAQYLVSGRLDVLESENGAMMELNSSLQEENRVLKQLVVSLQKGGMRSGSSLVFQQQVREQEQEIKVLKNTIHRLNVELSRFQAKYRPIKFEEVEGLSLPDSKEAAPWLINTKYLAPLFLAYDDRMKEKERLLKTYDEELTAFRARVMEVVRENQQLHLSQSKGSPNNIAADEWRQLQEQAKLVVEENAVLMEHQDLQDRKTKELQRSHAHEASKLSKRFSVLESEKRRLETELENVTRAHASLGRKYDSLLKDNESRIPLTDHMNMVDECRRLLEDVKEKAKAEQDDTSAMLEAIKKEKQSLATKLADSEARNTQMLRELEAYLKTLKKTERKVLLVQRQLEAVQHRERMAQETLSEVLKVAEKTAAERDGMVELAKSQNLEHRKAATIIKKGDQSIRGLEEKLAEYKSKASQKVASVNVKLREKEKEINRLKEEHEKELNSLRDLIRGKQRQLELVMGQSRRVDEKLERVWKEADVDNKRMKDTVRGRKGGAMFDSDSDPNPHQSSDEADK